MGNKKPLLSICIPTYNRGDILNVTLSSLVKDSAFGEDVEIIISDNASTDNTHEICNSYVEKYDNIYYYRNSENIKDQNFIRVLSLANGKYIKLFNDTLRFKPEMLEKMLGVIKNTNEAIHLLFFQNTPLHCYKSKRTTTLFSFVNATSLWITWIANVGFWKVDFDKLKDLNKYAELQLMQVDWLLQQASENEETVIIFDDYIEVASVSKKGGYNLFKVFVVNYLTILQKYLNTSLKLRFLLGKEKYRLLRYLIVYWYYNLVVCPSSQYCFEEKSATKIIMKEYWYCPYMYAGILVTYIKKIFSLCLNQINK